MEGSRAAGAARAEVGPRPVEAKSRQVVPSASFLHALLPPSTFLAFHIDSFLGSSCSTAARPHCSSTTYSAPSFNRLEKVLARTV